MAPPMAQGHLSVTSVDLSLDTALAFAESSLLRAERLEMSTLGQRWGTGSCAEAGRAGPTRLQRCVPRWSYRAHGLNLPGRGGEGEADPEDNLEGRAETGS